MHLPSALGDERGFVHKRLFRGLKGAVGGLLGGPGGVVGGAIGGFLAPGRPAPPTAFRVPGPPIPSRVPALSAAARASRAACPPGFAVDSVGGCHGLGPNTGQFIPKPKAPGVFPQALGSRNGARGDGDRRQDQLTLGGDAELGRFGAGINPAFFSQQTRRCPRGMVLGAPEADGESLCYNKRDLSNKERMWPRGRRPLLTGGEMRCISVASSAAKKLQTKQKQLQELGLLKPPPSRRRAAAPVHVRTAGVVHN